MNLRIDSSTQVVDLPPPPEIRLYGDSPLDLHGCYYCFYRGSDPNRTYLYEHSRSFGAVPLQCFGISFPYEGHLYEEGVFFRVNGVAFDANSGDPKIVAQWDGPASCLRDGLSLQLNSVVFK